ncbi:GroES-like protein [Trametes polyzona]|nr:GroES-like protein [Trametes polyzona]
MSLPPQQRALLLQKRYGQFVLGTRAIPRPGPGEIVVKNEAIGLNALDWKIQVAGIIVKQYPAVIGIDAAGIVEAVGEGVRAFKPGDRVLYVGEVENDHATYQEYTLVEAMFTAKIPASMSFEQAASLPLATCTAAVGLYHVQGGPRCVPPWTLEGRGKYGGTPILVIGGSTAHGSLAVQWARLSGFSPIIATSTSISDHCDLRKYGATHAIHDNNAYTGPTLLSALGRITGGRVPVIYDAISNADTQNAAFDVLSPGGKLLTIPPDAIFPDKKLQAQAPGDGRSVAHVLGVVQLPFLRTFGGEIFTNLNALLEEGALVPPNVSTFPGGLEGIPAGLERLKEGKVSAAMLVVRVRDTS